MEKLPEELQVADVPRVALLANTGCFVCRLDRPWCESVWFAMQDTIERIGDLWMATGESEDWHFSRRVAEEGGKVIATTIVPLIHRGIADYESNKVWGLARDRISP